VTDSVLRTYRTKLLFALRERDIPADRLATIIRAVETHVATTGEDPNTAFGPPETYAATFDPPAPRRTFDLAGISIPLLITGSALILVIDGIVAGGRFGIEPLYEVLVGLGFGVLAGIAWRKQVEPSPWWTATAITGIILCLGVLFGSL